MVTWIDDEGRLRKRVDDQHQFLSQIPIECLDPWITYDSWSIELAIKLITIGCNLDIEAYWLMAKEWPHGSTGLDNAFAHIEVYDRGVNIANSSIAAGLLKNPDSPANWLAWAKRKGYDVSHLEHSQTAPSTDTAPVSANSESLVVKIDVGDGTFRDALPVRAIPYVTGWQEHYGIEPQTIAKRLKPLEGADFTKWDILAHKLVNGKPVAVKRSEWRVVENRAASYSKRLHKQFPRDINGKVCVVGLAEWQSKSAEKLPQGVFVWFDEFKNAYCNYYKFQEVILPEPDPAPLLLSMQTKKMVLEGFEQAMLAAPEVTLGVSANDNERGAKLNAMLDRMNDPAYRRDLELVEVQSARLEKARERFAKWNEIGDGGTSVGLDLKETRLGDAKQELDELEERHKVMRGDIFPEPKTATVEANKKWTPAKLAELAIFRGAHTMPETAAQYGISEQRIRQLLPSKKPKASPFTGLIHRTK